MIERNFKVATVCRYNKHQQRSLFSSTSWNWSICGPADILNLHLLSNLASLANVLRHHRSHPLWKFCPLFYIKYACEVSTRFTSFLRALFDPSCWGCTANFYKRSNKRNPKRPSRGEDCVPSPSSFTPGNDLFQEWWGQGLLMNPRPNKANHK